MERRKRDRRDTPGPGLKRQRVTRPDSAADQSFYPIRANGASPYPAYMYATAAEYGDSYEACKRSPE